ncbi:hypothetical protein A7P23_02635 [Achromobacter xylosoxidans]|nr:hypothetical protein A7P23_02635 [Achromobacter xylosoxidans]
MDAGFLLLGWFYALVAVVGQIWDCFRDTVVLIFTWLIARMDALNVIYLVTAGPGLLIVAGFAAQQVLSAREAIKLTKHIEERRIVTDLCRSLRSYIVDVYNARIGQLSVPDSHRLAKVDAHEAGWSIEFPSDPYFAPTKKVEPLESLAQDVLNRLEFFAQEAYPMLEKNGDYLYASVGFMYVNMIERSLPYVYPSMNPGKWSWAFGLYYYWKCEQGRNYKSPWSNMPWEADAAPKPPWALEEAGPAFGPLRAERWIIARIGLRAMHQYFLSVTYRTK